MLCKKSMSPILNFLVILLVFYIILIAAVYVFQSKMIYFPDKHLIYFPNQMGMDYNDVYFTSNDNVKLNGWFIPGESPDRIVLFCHGNAGNISHRLESIRIFNKLDLGVFIFDYRGYGKSEGSTDEEGTYFDGEAAWNYLTTEMKIDSNNILIFGRSLGCGIAAWLAKEKSPCAVILESSFKSIPDLGSKIYPFIPIRLISRFNYSVFEYVQKSHCPKLFIHSVQDEIIPFEQGKQNFEIASEPKELFEIKGSHNDGFFLAGQAYEDRLKQFIDKVFNEH